jgi:hypothetical protein
LLELLGTVAGHPPFAEGRITQGLPEGRTALVEDFLTVRDEQQPSARQHSSQARVVEGRHHCLASSSGRDEQIPVMPGLARERDQLKQSFLKRFEADLDGTGHADVIA